MSQRVALLFVLSTAAAAAAGPASAAAPEPPGAAPSDSRIWTEGGRVFLSGCGADAQELRLRDAAETGRLLGLLRQHAATGPEAGVSLERVLLAGAGGAGFDYAPRSISASPRQANSAPDSVSYGSALTPAKKPAGARSARPGSAKPRGGDKE